MLDGEYVFVIFGDFPFIRVLSHTRGNLQHEIEIQRWDKSRRSERTQREKRTSVNRTYVKDRKGKIDTYVTTHEWRENPRRVQTRIHHLTEIVITATWKREICWSITSDQERMNTQRCRIQRTNALDPGIDNHVHTVMIRPSLNKRP